MDHILAQHTINKIQQTCMNKNFDAINKININKSMNK